MKYLIGIILSFLIIDISNAQALERNLQLEKIASGHLVADVSINGKQSKFIVDTGATSSVIDSRLVRTLNLTKNKETEVTGFIPGKNTLSMSQYTVKSVVLGDVFNSEITFVEQNIAPVFAGLASFDIDGIIGQDVLVDSGLLLDVKATSLVQSEGLDLSHYQTVPLKISKVGLPLINMSINEQEVRMVLDSGANDIMLDEALATAMDLGDIIYPAGMVGYDEKGKSRQIGVIKESRISIAGKSIDATLLTDDFALLLNAINETSKLKSAGLLGLSTLAELSAIIDLKNQRLYVK